MRDKPIQTTPSSQTVTLPAQNTTILADTYTTLNRPNILAKLSDFGYSAAIKKSRPKEAILDAERDLLELGRMVQKHDEETYRAEQEYREKAARADRLNRKFESTKAGVDTAMELYGALEKFSAGDMLVEGGVVVKRRARCWTESMMQITFRGGA
ncbi:uncharacterized protein BDV17DRAFT_68455 [Aspergillus undulatus]|uniref:uncharacterized protein n=1 Tax=Aspergillus undulatus TaxID=1810928 RepID=UPI003CCDC42E